MLASSLKSFFMAFYKYYVFNVKLDIYFETDKEANILLLANKYMQRGDSN